MATSEDQEVKDLLQVTILEYLRSWYLLQRESEKFMQPETRKMFDTVKGYLEEPAKDEIPVFLWKQHLSYCFLYPFGMKSLTDCEPIYYW